LVVAAPRIILRFRELTPGIDTIAAHRKILARASYVWWGWWKKETEVDPGDTLQKLRLRAQSPPHLSVTLIDTSAERMYEATAVDILRALPDEEREKVPEYYRERAKLVFAWFRLIDLRPAMQYDRDLEERVGQGTIAVTEDDHGG
jgi:hypothetical protein